MQLSAASQALLPHSKVYVSCEAGRERPKAGREFHSRRSGVWKRDIIPI
jgi:hypothetical protein